MDTGFNFSNKQGVVSLSGELNLQNSNKIWEKLNKLSDKTKEIRLENVNSVDITLLQQLVLLKQKYTQVKIKAFLPASSHSVILNCGFKNLFTHIEETN